jgi:hypothetical protein
MIKSGILQSAVLLTWGLASGACAGWSDYLDKLGGALSGPQGGDTSTLSSLSEQEMVAGLKQALEKGTQFAVDSLGRQGGFLDDARVRIPIPDSLSWVEKSLRAVHQDALADQFVTSMNRAAEQAVPEAAEVFGAAIQSMSLEDAKSILSGPEDAASEYFRTHTYDALSDKIRPIVSRTTESAGVTSSYKRMMSSAGGLGGFLSGDATDLDGYVTQKTLDGLFLMVAEEEKRIREDPMARSTELLKKVFGSVSP